MTDKSCLGCLNRGICMVFMGIQRGMNSTNYHHPPKSWVQRRQAEFTMKFTTFLFSNEEEIYGVLAKTCLRYDAIPMLKEKTRE